MPSSCIWRFDNIMSLVQVTLGQANLIYCLASTTSEGIDQLNIKALLLKNNKINLSWGSSLHGHMGNDVKLLCLALCTSIGSAMTTCSSLGFWKIGDISHMLMISSQTRCRNTGNTFQRSIHNILRDKLIFLTWSAECNENIWGSTFIELGNFPLKMKGELILM